jgi:hypothetical protein
MLFLAKGVPTARKSGDRKEKWKLGIFPPTQTLAGKDTVPLWS